MSGTQTDRVPGPEALGPRLARLRRDPIGMLTDLTREYGDVVRFKFGLEHVHFLNHPDLIREVLVTSSGKFHKGPGFQDLRRVMGDGLFTSEAPLHHRQRRLAQPAMHHSRVSAYADVMARIAESRAARWRDGERLRVDAEMSALTLAIVGKALFDVDFEEEDGRRVREAITVVLELFNRQRPAAVHAATDAFQGAMDELDAIIYGLIREHRAGPDRGDFLSMLLMARDEDAGSADGGMSDQQLRDEAITLVLAGHETTALALTWTLYSLTLFPDVEEELHREVDAVLGGRTPTYGDLASLTFTRMTFAEGIRMFPPVWAIDRRLLVDHEIGGHLLPAGSVVWLCPYVTQHDPRWWPEPERFDPLRFLPEAEAARPKYAYFPFSAGPRLCYGEPFAWMEGTLVLATIASRWRFDLAPGHPVEMLPIGTLRQRHGMAMDVHAR